MTAKEYLRQYEYAAKRVKRLEDEYITELIKKKCEGIVDETKTETGTDCGWK